MNLLIENGTVYTGNPNQKAKTLSILIENGVIKQVSEQSISVSNEVKKIDASGMWVMPGFLDTHTHYDAEIIASPGLKESARHGVTTVVLGSCSVSAIYNNPEETSDCFTRVEAIPREVMLPLMEQKKTWNSPKEWIEYIESSSLGINVSAFVGHSDLRVKVMGMERSVKEGEKATEKERKEMELLLKDALDAGFLGMSTMDSPWDKMDGEKYWSHKTPSFYASWKERRNLIELLRKENAILQGAPNLVTRVSAGNYMMASTGIFRKPLKTTMIAMMDLIGDRYILNLTNFLSTLFNKGFKADFRMQSPPVPFTVYYDGVDSVMFEEFPSGEALRDLAKNLERRNKKMKDPAFRNAFKKEIKNKFAPKVWHKDLSKSIMLKCPDQSLIGKDFYTVAMERGEHPVDTFLDLIIDYDKQISWTTTIANDRKEKYKTLYDNSNNLISFSDAGAHLNNMAFYDFPLQMIKRVHDSISTNQPLMSMEKCVWRLTKELADWFNIEGGEIVEGKPADIVLIDPSKLGNITGKVEEAPIEEFNQYPRLVNRHQGVVCQVIVNGNVIYKDNDFVAGYAKERCTGEFRRRKFDSKI